MNDFSRLSELLFSILFADDTSVFIEGTSVHDISNILNKELENISIWLEANKLTIYINKTQYMMFHVHVSCTCKHEKMYIDYSAFMVYTFGTIFQNIFPLMYHMLVIKKLIQKLYNKITIYSIELSKFSNHYIQHSMLQNRKLYMFIVILS